MSTDFPKAADLMKQLQEAYEQRGEGVPTVEVTAGNAWATMQVLELFGMTERHNHRWYRSQDWRDFQEKSKKENRMESIDIREAQAGISLRASFTAHIEVHSVDLDGLHGKLVLGDSDEVEVEGTLCKFVSRGRELRLLGKRGKKAARVIGAAMRAQIANQLADVERLMRAAYEVPA